MTGEVNEIKLYIKEAVGGKRADPPTEYATTYSLLHKSGIYEVLKPIYLHPEKISSCLSGTNNKALFENIYNTNFDWKNIFNRDAFGSASDAEKVNAEIIKFVRRRHEIGNWEFPKLTDREKFDAVTLNDLLKNYKK